MTAALPSSLDQHAAAISDVLEGLLANWQELRLPPAEAISLVRQGCHELSSLRDAGLSAAEPLSPLDRAQKALAAAKDAAPHDDRASLEELLAELVSLRKNALDRVGSYAAVPPLAAPLGIAFPASIGTPAIRRGVTVPPLSLIRPQVGIEDVLAGVMERDQEDEAEDDDDEALAPTPERARTLEERRREPIYRQLHALGRDLMEDVGMLGTLRRPLPDEVWLGPERFEQRLFAQLDALFSLTIPAAANEPVYALVEELYAYATEWAIPDLGRAFALALPLGCIDGEPSVRWLVTLLRHAHPQTHPAIVDALCLGPNPRIAPALADALSGTEPLEVVLALLEAARRRADVPASALAMALDHPDERVVAAALRALGRVDPSISVPLLNDALGLGGAPAVAAAEGLAGFGEKDVFVTLRGWLEADPGPDPGTPAFERSAAALRALACRGDMRDEPVVLRAAFAQPGGLRFLGTFGYPPHAELLFEHLDSPDRRIEARRGLRIMLGGDFESTQDDFDRDPPIAEEILRDRSERRAKARAASGRLRRGQSHRGALTLVSELADPLSRGVERPDLAFELGMLVRTVLPFDSADFISRQKAGIELLRGALGRT
ncbi:MAG: hypothetical protein HOV80_06895 [Polyangiaceae bacterium]|nr:hypothetical protein [Polyangiaceae bacterium]